MNKLPIDIINVIKSYYAHIHPCSNQIKNARVLKSIKHLNNLYCEHLINFEEELVENIPKRYGDYKTHSFTDYVFEFNDQCNGLCATDWWNFQEALFTLEYEIRPPGFMIDDKFDDNSGY